MRERGAERKEERGEEGREGERGIEGRRNERREGGWKGGREREGGKEKRQKREYMFSIYMKRISLYKKTISIEYVVCTSCDWKKMFVLDGRARLVDCKP